MTVDRDTTVGGEPGDGEPPGAADLPMVSRAALVGYAAGAVLLVGWFLFGALVLRQGVVNSAGETLGTAFAVLLVVSAVGMLRSSRR